MEIKSINTGRQNKEIRDRVKDGVKKKGIYKKKPWSGYLTKEW